MRTGEEVRVSAAISTASFVKKPWLFLPNSLNAACKRVPIIVGSQKCNGLDIRPGVYELSGKS